jgi:hypothetical protein
MFWIDSLFVAESSNANATAEIFSTVRHSLAAMLSLVSERCSIGLP